MLRWPGPEEVVFSLKSFAAAMAAFWVACWLDLPRPIWAVFTVYIVMQPVSGAVRSKAWYRFAGTLVGAAITLFLIGLLVDLPALLFLVLGAFVLGCIFLSMIDLMPRGYAYALVGVTALVVGIPTLPDPSIAFDTAIARTEEILLGVLSAVVIDSLVFPRPAGRLLNRQVASWLAAAGKLTGDALARAPPSNGPDAALGQLAVDAAVLDALSAHIAYDTVAVRPNPRYVRLLHTRMLRLLSIVFAAGAWLQTLRTELPEPSVEPALAALRDWGASLPNPTSDQTAAVRRGLELFRLPPGASLQRTTMIGSIGLLLGTLVDVWEDCIVLRKTIETAVPLPVALQAVAQTESLSIPYADKLRAVLILLPTALAFLAVFAYWSATGWDQGSTAALNTLTVGLLVGTHITPIRRAKVVTLLFAVGAVLTLIYQFAVLPAITDFPLLVFALGVFLIPAGMFIPVTGGTAMLLVVLTLLQLGLQPDYQAQFQPVLEGIFGTLTGISVAAAVAWLLAVPTPAWTVRHLRKVGWSHLAEVAAGTWQPSQSEFARRGLDRFAAIAAQLPTASETEAPLAGDLLAEIRVGVNMLHLQEVRGGLPIEAEAAIDAVLAGVADRFRRLGQGSPVADAGLLARTQAGLLATAKAMPDPTAATAWTALVGTRRWLFSNAPGHPVPEALNAQ